MTDQTIIVLREPSTNDKLIWSAVGAAIFVLLSLPYTYMQTSRVTTTATLEDCPTPEGKFIHSAVFFAVNYLIMKVMANQRMMNMDMMSDGLMAKYSFYATLLFFVIASSDTYAITGKFISGVTNEVGCPTSKGVIVNGIVFLVILFLMMYFPKDM